MIVKRMSYIFSSDLVKGYCFKMLARDQNYLFQNFNVDVLLKDEHWYIVLREKFVQHISTNILLSKTIMYMGKSQNINGKEQSS